MSGCTPSTPLPQTLDPDLLVLTDNFESGTFGAWTSVTAEGDAKAVVDWPTAHTGTCGGHFTISSSSTSRANITRSLPALTTDVWADGWFHESGEGLSNSNVGFFRFFDGSNRIADVYRQNISGGYWLRTSNGTGGWNFTQIGSSVLPLNRWYHIKLHVLAAGSLSTCQVWLDGTRLYSSTTFWLPTSHLTTVLLGSEHVSQMMDLHFDDIVIHAA